MDILDSSAKQGLTYLEVVLYPTKIGVTNCAASGGKRSRAELKLELKCVGCDCPRAVWTGQGVNTPPLSKGARGFLIKSCSLA